MLNERSDFPGIETIETKERLAIMQGQKLVKTTVGFSREKAVESMDRLGIIHGRTIVETTVGFFS